LRTSLDLPVRTLRRRSHDRLWAVARLDNPCERLYNLSWRGPRRRPSAASTCWSYRRASTEKRIATNCDLCESLDGNPRYVKHCLHEAALRMEGVELARLIGLNPAGVAGAEP
jgi:hypothetical protein